MQSKSHETVGKGSFAVMGEVHMKMSKSVGEKDITTETSKGGERSYRPSDGLRRKSMKLKKKDNQSIA